MNRRERVLGMMAGRPVDRLPVMPITMMFAADQLGVPYGRYAQDFGTLAEAQLLTADRFGLDHVSVISDPAREAADCGAEVRYFDDQPPAIAERTSLLADKARLTSLNLPDPLGGGRMHDRVRAVARLRERVGGQLAIEGWVEGPLAEAADLRGASRLMLDFHDDPAFACALLEFTLALGLRFARAQVEAGADYIGVGDAVASLVGPRMYEAFVLPYERRLVEGLHALGTRVRLHICGNTTPILAGMATLGADLIDLDWMVPLARARQVLGPGPVLAGNLDPVKALCEGTPESVGTAVARCYREAGPRYAVAAGCEVPRQTPPANVAALAAAARALQERG
jgi:MtaA/CmuA family methyltransferase